jgi:Flp pilus assembly protein TadD
MRAAVLSLVALVAFEATAASNPRRPAFSEAELLSGAALGLSPVAAVIGREEAFGLDDEIRAFVAAHRAGHRRADLTLRRLLNGMEERGLFELVYTEEVTRTASATFHERRGNCLSFTMLFVALAREAGLDVAYQLVDVPPTWEKESDLIVFGTHVNALVSMAFDGDYIVDFNLRELETRYESRKVDDDYVLALFYSNLGAEALLDRDYERSLSYLKAAATVDPRNAGPWVNIGVLYARHGRYEHAEAAYLRALAADRRNRSALSNLASLYAQLGNERLADEYGQRVRSYQESNPFYHYGIAEQAYAERSFEPALQALRRALRLKRDDHRFYALQGRVYRELGDRMNAARSLGLARDHAASAELKARYATELRALEPAVSR